MFRRSLAGAVVALTALALLSTLPAAAAAKVGIYDENGAEVGRIEKAKCKVKGPRGNKRFVAFGEGPGGWELDVYIAPGFWGGFRTEYTLLWGDQDVGFDLFAPDGTLYSNQFPFPGPNSPGAGGAIKFSRGGKRLGIGFITAWVRDYSTGVVFAGGMKCKYPRR